MVRPVLRLVPSLVNRLRELRYGFLAVPGLITLGFVVAAEILAGVDRWAGGAHGVGGFDGDAHAARTLLATIAGSLITVAGVTFSITVVSLQLVSQQFSPRALRTLLRDALTQVVIGAFAGTFVYSLLVLASVRSGGDAGFVPSLAVIVAIALAVVTIALLLAFIHHLTRTIQVSTISARICRDTLARIDDLYPERYGDPAGRPRELLAGWERQPPALVVRGDRAGFLQVVGLDSLPEVLRQPGQVAIDAAPGEFVTPRTPLARIWGGRASAADAKRLFAVANERDLRDDVGYGIRQLADIAIRAISPSVNDPTTATTCISYLRAIGERLTERPPPVTARRLADGTLLVARTPDYADYLRAAFADVSRYARGDRRVLETILAALRELERITLETDDCERRRQVGDLVEEVGELALAQAEVESDRRAIAETIDGRVGAGGDIGRRPQRGNSRRTAN